MEAYTYTPLDLNEPTFRLVRLFGGVQQQLQCALVHGLLIPGHVMDYEAVSYTWGPIKPHPLFLEVHAETITKLSISYNMYHLLLDLRHTTKDRMLWIDAICINQDAEDTTERNHQVQQMARIYREAECVIVWLGRPTHEIDLAMSWLIELQRERNTNWKTSDIQAFTDFESFQISNRQSQHDIKRQGIKRIFRLPWFRRIWILQEVGNARKAVIVCGKKAVSSTVFSRAPSGFNIKIDSHCQAVLNLMPGSQARLKSSSQARDLRTLLRYFRKAKATVAHDHIYALLGLCSEESQHMTVSYEKPISTVISEAISLICHYDVTSTPEPLYNSIPEFQADIDNLDEQVLRNLIISRYIDNLEVIFNQRKVNIDVTEGILGAAIHHLRDNEELFHSILRRTQPTGITDNVLLTAIEYAKTSPGYYLDLVFKKALPLAITQKVLIAAVDFRGLKPRLLKIIVQQAPISVITEKVMWFVIMYRTYLNKKVLRLIISRASNSAITPNVLRGIITSTVDETRDIDIKFIQKAPESSLTKEVVELAVRYRWRDRELMDIILRRAEIAGFISQQAME